VLIHGVGQSGKPWADDLAGLAADCRLIVYDRRGYGSSGSSPRDWQAHREDAAALIEALQAVPAVIAGYSGGCIVALDLVLKRPDLAMGVVLIDPACNIGRCITPGLVRALATAHVLRGLRGEERGAESWLRYLASYPTGGSALDRVSAERRAHLLANTDGIFADLGSGGGAHVDETRLAAIDPPVTIVTAKLSPPFLRSSSERLRRLMPQARSLTLEHSGHFVAVDAHDELLAILGDATRAAAAAHA
jgi:pimeloyl-ACP methyl ester carboxylesterase